MRLALCVVLLVAIAAAARGPLKCVHPQAQTLRFLIR